MNSDHLDNPTNRYTIIAGVAFLTILILIALYLYGGVIQNENRQIQVPTYGPAIESTSSDNLSDIEADLESFSPEDLETTDTVIESTIEAEL